MSRYIKREDAVFAACKVLDKFGGCKMGPLCPDVGCSEVRDIIDTFQMIEIPDQHGRLIDADAFTKYECNNCDGACEALPCNCLNCESDCRCDFMKDIADAPTIIPAEEGER